MNTWTGIPILALLLMTGCGPKVVFEKTVKLNGVWTYANSQSFEFEVKDTTPAYDLFLDVSHISDFPYQNIYTQVKTVFPDRKEVEHVISLNLADENNQWVGDCSSSSCLAHLVLSENIYFNTPGRYKIILQQFGRKDSLQGVESLHFTLSEHPNDE